MKETKDIPLPSGAVLKYQASPFETSLNLYEAVVAELETLKVSFASSNDVTDMVKIIFCRAFTSPRIKTCLWECFKRCLYNDGQRSLRIDKDTFEPIHARQDYQAVCLEVAKEELIPFGSEGFVKFAQFIAATLVTQKSE